MSVAEIVLIIAGITVFLMGYIIPARKMDIGDELQLIGEDEVRKLVDREMEGMKDHLSDFVDETVSYTIEKTERSMERTANEKIMAINEYSDTVLEEINKNHKEVLFLYDMLNDKHENLKNTVSEAFQAADGIKQTVKDAEITAKETKDIAKSIQSMAYAEMTARETRESVKSIQFIEDSISVREPEETLEVVEDVVSEPETFAPFIPPRVEIVHAPNGDYVAPPPSEDELETFMNELDIPHWIGEVNHTPQPEEELWQGEILPQQPMAALDTDRKDSARNSNERILELHKAGKSNIAIARELGLGVGEVKLVIDLFEGL